MRLFSSGVATSKVGPRIDDIEHTSWRVVIGTRRAKSTMPGSTMLAANTVTFSVRKHSTTIVSIRKVSNALSVVDYNPATGIIGGAGGVPTCTSALPASFSGMYPNAGSDPSCVPWNIFQTGGVNAKAINYIAASLSDRGEVTQEILASKFHRRPWKVRRATPRRPRRRKGQSWVWSGAR